MTIKLLTLIGFFFITGCLLGDTQCCDLIGSNQISTNLYIERYRTFCAGVFGERIDCYLTDSVSFRQLIGDYDEHGSLTAEKNGNNLEVYNIESITFADTLEKKTISKTELLTKHHSDSSCLVNIPIFGKNTIKCNNYYPAWSYKTDDNYYLTQTQYKCENDFLNAVYYTDSLNFRIFIGIYSPGSFSNNYFAIQNINKDFDFFNVEYKHKTDTVKRKTYLLSELKKGKLTKVCK
jgi:hypothetical protein